MAVDYRLLKVTKWSLVATGTEAPEVRSLSIRGEVDGHPIESGGIKSRVGPRTYLTHDHVVLALEGAPEAGYVDWCERNGIELDVGDPVKFRIRREDFEWLPQPGSLEQSLAGWLQCSGMIDSTAGRGHQYDVTGKVCQRCGADKAGPSLIDLARHLATGVPLGRN